MPDVFYDMRNSFISFDDFWWSKKITRKSWKNSPSGNFNFQEFMHDLQYSSDGQTSVFRVRKKQILIKSTLWTSLSMHLQCENINKLALEIEKWKKIHLIVAKHATLLCSMSK